MKWAMAQIRKLNTPFTVEYDYDLKSALVSFEDVLDVNKCHVNATCHRVSYEEYLFDLSIDCELVMQCSVSLEEVIVPLVFDTEVRFSYNEDDSCDDYLIEKETIFLDDAVLSEIVLNIPYKVVKEGYEDLYQEAPLDYDEKYNGGM